MQFSDQGQQELAVLIGAVEEIVELSFKAFRENDLELAYQVEPLEQVIDDLKERLRRRHIRRLQAGECSIELGFVWSDLLTGLERVGDHCSNIAACVIDLHHHDMNMHQAIHELPKENRNFKEQYRSYTEKYSL